MVQSKFTVWTYVLFITSLFLLSIVFILLSLLFEDPSTGTIIVILICSLLFIFILTWLVWGELRTKAIKILIESGKIKTRNFAGLGNEKIFPVPGINGYKTSLLPAAYRDYEYLYLFVNDQKVIKLSEFYHKNYSVLKEYIVSNCKQLDSEKFSLKKEIGEIFK